MIGIHHSLPIYVIAIFIGSFAGGAVHGAAAR